MKIINSVSFVLLGLMVAWVLLLAFWQLYPYKIQDYENPIAILNDNHIIHPGEAIRWRIHVTNYGAFPFNSTQEIIAKDDQAGCDYKLLLSLAGELEVGEINRVNATSIVPLYLKPCIYYVRISTIYTVNPIRKVTIIKQTDDFIVK